MREYKDEVYVFSLAKNSAWNVIASRTPSGERHVGRSILSSLKVNGEDNSFFEEAWDFYGKQPIAVLCKGEKRETAIFFRNLEYGASLGFAVVTRFDAGAVSAVLRSGVLGDILVSDNLKNASDGEFSYEKHKEVYRYLLDIFTCVESISALRLAYEPSGIDALIRCAQSTAYLADVKVNIDAHGADDNELFKEVDDIFDGRICAAIFLLVAIATRNHTRSKEYSLELVGGIRSLSLKIELKANDEGWRKAFDHIKNVAEYNRGIPFVYEVKRGRVRVAVVPFYADIGFVGVKENDYVMSLLDIEGDR